MPFLYVPYFAPNYDRLAHVRGTVILIRSRTVCMKCGLGYGYPSSRGERREMIRRERGREHKREKFVGSAAGVD